DWPEQLDFIADVADFLVNAVFTASVVRQHSAIKFFRTDARLAPEEIEHARGAARNRLIGEQPDHARSHKCTDLLPVDVAGCLFDYTEAAIVDRPFDVGFIHATFPSP